jgi:hypothetical protein
MLVVLALFILSVTIFVVLLLVIVVVGIRQEPPTEELSEQASSFITAFVRRLIGLHVRKPDSPPRLDHGNERPYLAPDSAPGPNTRAECK